MVFPARSKNLHQKLAMRGGGSGLLCTASPREVPGGRLPFRGERATSLSMMRKVRFSRPLPIMPDRRQFLAGLALGAGLGPALAQQSPPVMGGQRPAIQPMGPAQGESLRATVVPARLVSSESTESTLFRFLPENAPSTPAGIAPDMPILRFKPSGDARIALRNELAQPLALALRGMRRPLAGDALTGIAPGQNGHLVLPTTQGGSFLLQPGPGNPVREAVARGLHGLVIVDEAQPPEVDRDLALLVADWRLTDKGELAGDFGDLRDAARMGRLGNRLTVNGHLAPMEITVRPGARLRLRLANVAPARTIPLHAQKLTARVIAIDSTPCAPFDPLQKMVTLAPGNRCEMIVDCPREAGVEARVEAKFATPAPLLIIRTEGEPIAARGPVAALPDPGLPAAIKLQNAARADLAITGGWAREANPDPDAMRKAFPDPARIFQLNGGGIGDRPGEALGKPVLRVKRGREVVLALMNRTAWPQVIGVAGHSFRLLHPFDDGWEPYFLDTVYVGPGQTLRIAFIADLLGRHAIRSTIADHAEAGVATHIEVTA